MNAAFYDVVRPMFGGALEPVQVQVMDGLFEAGKHLPRAHLAYIFATAYGEAKMIPRRENMNYSAARIRQVWPSRPAAVQYAGKPKALANEVYGGRLGNRRGTDDGWDYRGGGIDQLTGRDNYAKVGIADKPQAILEPGKAVASIIHGMTTGRYTGKKLADYDKAGGFDFVGARAIVNGDGRLNGEKYAGYARKFLAAMQASGATTVKAEIPAATAPKAPPAMPAPTDGGSWLVRLLAGLVAMFGKGK